MRLVPAFVVGLLAALLVLALVPPALAAPTGPAITGLEPTELHPKAPADIDVGSLGEVSAILHDKVTEIGLAGENVSFSVQTTFGWLLLKEAVTNAQGVAYLDYDPVAAGNYTIQVAFAGNVAYAPSNASVIVTAIAGPATPPPLLGSASMIVLVILAVVGGVWATFGYVAFQILGIRADPPETERKDRRARSRTEVKKHMADADETPNRVSGSANAGGRAVLIVAALALVLGAAGLGLGAMSALAPKSTYTPTTVSFEVAVVPDIQGAAWDAFVPDSLVVHQGDTVKITVINADTMDHGFQLDAFNVNVHIDPGTANATTGEVTPTTTVITFTATQSGTFTFRCNVVCGAGHDYMTGTLEVLPD